MTNLRKIKKFTQSFFWVLLLYALLAWLALLSVSIGAFEFDNEVLFILVASIAIACTGCIIACFESYCLKDLEREEND